MYSNFPYQIILASASPRRKELLSQLGFSFKVEIRPVDETIIIGKSPLEMAIMIAQEKLEAFDIKEYQNPTLIITADTIVSINDTVLGKPKNVLEAKQMLRELSGRKHKVITAVCIKTASIHETFYDETDVEFSSISDDEIDYYIQEFNPLDKAGSYGIQDWIGVGFIHSIKGSYTNVVGFPTELVRRKLLGIIS
jgi:septum formation protein